jgi:hypothetical protein
MRYNAVMAEAWQAAKLLEEIINKSEPLRILEFRRTGPKIIKWLPPSNDHPSLISYGYPVQEIMQGTDGSPQEVLERLRTRLRHGQWAKVVTVPEKGPHFVLTTIITDPKAIRQLRQKLSPPAPQFDEPT